MNSIEEYLEFFIAMTQQVDKKFGNDEFSKKLQAEISKKTTTNLPGQIADLLELHNDLKRTRQFLRFIDQKAAQEGRDYHNAIKDVELRRELVKDFKQMRLADIEGDIIEFTRRIVMQLENSINKSIELLDAWSVIRSNPSQYQDRFHDLFRGEYSFFRDGKNRELKDVVFPSKVFFVNRYYSIRYFESAVREMNTIRNKASHRGGLSEKEKEIMDQVTKNVTAKKADYFQAFNIIIRALRILY